MIWRRALSPLAWAVATTLLATVAYLQMLRSYDRESQLMVEQHLAALDVAYRSTIEMHRLDVETRLRSEVLSPDVLELLLQIDSAEPETVPLLRGRLFRQLWPRYREMAASGLRQVQFHRPDGRSLLRMLSPELTDDPLFDRRPSVRLVNTRLDAVSGFEGGGIMPGFRNVYPIIVGSRHLGSVELSMSFDRLHENLARLMPSSDIALLMHRRVTLDIVLPGMEHRYVASALSPNYYLEHPDISPVVQELEQSERTKALHPALTARSGLESALAQQRSFVLPLRVDGRGYAVAFLAVQDIEQRHAAYLLSYSEVPPLMGLYRSTRTKAGLMAVLVLFVGLAGWGLRQQSHRLQRKTRQLEIITESMADGLFVQDRAGRATFVNRAASRLLGYDPQEMLGHEVHALIHRQPGQAAGPLEHCPIHLAAELGCPYAGEEVFLTRNGQALSVEVRSEPLMLNESVRGSVTLFRDTTAQRAAQARLRLAATVFDHANEGISITDARGHFLEVNEAFTRITGYARDQVVGRNPRILGSGRQSSTFYTDMWQTVIREGRWRGEVWNRHADGRHYAGMLTVTAVREEGGDIHHFVGILSDITALKEHAEELEHIARHDALTGVANRRLLQERLAEALSRADSFGDQVAVAYLDLDGFKDINDRWGHEAGDRLLMECARRLRHCLRERDTVARLGGDEFVLVLSHVQRDADWQGVVERVLHSLAEPFDDQGRALQVTVSIGITRYPADVGDADTLLRHADHAMYLAKQAGKNRWVMFNPDIERETQARTGIARAMRQAILNDELRLHFQPQVDLRTGAVVGLEALVRWQHPQQGLLSPGAFLPPLAGTAELVALDQWVLQSALNVLARSALPWPGIRVSVNLSSHSLEHPDFLKVLGDLLARYPTVSSAQLELELLETAALGDLNRVCDLMTRCQQLGVRFAIDDFGTGYSTLTYVRRLPAGTLKIDQSFVRDMLEDADDYAIVQAVIGLARSFGREVVAEGVETARHGLALLKLGCFIVQGYGVARPMPAHALAAWSGTWPQQWHDHWRHGPADGPGDIAPAELQ